MIELDKLPKGWTVAKLGEIVITDKGKKPKRVSKVKTDECSIPYVNIKAFEKNIIDEYTDGVGCVICEDDDFLMVWDGSRSGYVGKAIKGALGSTLVRIKLPLMNQDYVYYFLQSKFIEINTRAKGVGIPHVDPHLLWNYDFYIAPLNEQKRILAKLEQLLTDLDKGIEYLETTKQQLKVYRQAVLKWAFEGRLTNTDVKDGELPNGWRTEKLGNIFEVYIGSTPSRKRPDYWKGHINWISSGEVAFCRIHESNEKITQLGLNESSCKLHPPGTVIMAMIGEGKTRGQAAILKCEATHNQNTAAIRVDANVYLPDLLYYYFVYTYNKNRGIGSGNNQKALNKERIKQFDIPFIPSTEQKIVLSEIESRLSVCDKIEETIESSLQQAEALRLSIIKKAFEGKLVPQDPNDEPAEKLLERIRAAKGNGKPEKKENVKSEKKVKIPNRKTQLA